MSPVLQEMLLNLAPTAAGVAGLVLLANFAIYKYKLMRQSIEEEERELHKNDYKSSPLSKSPMANPVLASPFASEFAVNLKVVKDGKSLVNIDGGSLSRPSKIAQDEDLAKEAIMQAHDQYSSEMSSEEIPSVVIEEELSGLSVFSHGVNEAGETDPTVDYTQQDWDRNEYEALQMSLPSYDDAHSDPESFARYQQNMKRINELKFQYGW